MIERDLFSDREAAALFTEYLLQREKFRFTAHGGRGTNKLARARTVHRLALAELGPEASVKLETKLQRLLDAIMAAGITREDKRGDRRRRKNAKRFGAALLDRERA